MDAQTQFIGRWNDTLDARHLGDVVRVQCQRGYTFTDGDMVKDFTCRELGDSLGWYTEGNDDMSTLSCSEGKK